MRWKKCGGACAPLRFRLTPEAARLPGTNVTNVTACELRRHGLVDRLVTWGSAGTITARVNEHLRAGADHVALTVLDNDRQPAIDSARQLARSLFTRH